jgi:pimeloyl-ACP methyl ester carboxylesterase
MVVKGRRTHYLKAGRGPAVVLLHGGASDARDWLGTMAALAHRFTCYAPDIIGFGRSERNEEGYFLTDFVEFIENFIFALGLDSPDMVGHSFGGRIGAGVVVRGWVAIRRLVMVDATGFGKISAFGNVLFTGFWLLRKALGKPQPFPRFRVKDGEDYNMVRDEELRGLQSSTLLIWKSRDPYIPVAQARRALELIPEARLEVLRGYGHAPAKQDSKVFNRLLLEFLGGD